VRVQLSDLLTNAALQNPNVIVISGDHGYSLFDQIRSKAPQQFLNVGVMEQAMVGMAAGLAKTGFRPIVYGLAAFVPVRVLEQIKLDVCFPNLPVIFLGDGAGLVYSTLGSSHQCAEDLSCLRPMPNIKIFSPADAAELTACFNEAFEYSGPSYIRLGKSDRPTIHGQVSLRTTDPVVVNAADRKTIFAATGSMVSVAQQSARELGVTCISLPRIKPMAKEILNYLLEAERLFVFEEHSRYGGLTSAILDYCVEAGVRPPLIKAFTLQDHFAEKCGSYQFALSEHQMSDSHIKERVQEAWRDEWDANNPVTPPAKPN
jgi:transketolase